MAKGMKTHINVANVMMATFMHAIWSRVAAAAEARGDAAPWKTKHRMREGSRLPKGFKDHNPAGMKLARMAASGAIGMRGRVALID